MLIELKLLGPQKPNPAAQPEGAQPPASPAEPLVAPSPAPPQPAAAAPVVMPETHSEQRATRETFLFDGHMGTRLLLCGTILVATWYINTSALKYLTVSRDTYGIFWPRHEWLFAHALAGTLALFIGPFQFWPGLKQSRPMLHRVMGVIYAASALVGAVAALYLAFHTDFGWMYAMGLTSMAMAWMISTGLATIAIYRQVIPQHKEWMVRSYVVTFGFVVLRIVADVLESRNIGSVSDRLAVGSWICWSVPLLITEALMQGRKVFAARPSKGSPSATI
jgi:hypothetical protein